ncbi:vicilin-like seed storage protein [Cinnamomum micranthum f. kanehirae]|uniref:Vicilin-like seed storage protein n=1 Tax=Cinnamomum micranthum f. kanehirae TaxID=337451 RepID=A0A3S4N339_9MAGN|nr:vicilin-like seed storage protein [Cinnamomum micranthum f. kanehirae]
MAKEHRNGSLQEPDREAESSPSKPDRSRRSKRRKDDSDESSASEDDKTKRKRRRSSRRSRRHESDYDSSSLSDSSSSLESPRSESDGSDSAETGSEREREMRRRKRKERRRRKEREYEKERERKKKEKEKRRKKEREESRKKKKKKKEKEKKKDKGKKGAVTNSWGKYGIIRETDMWNKRPEFTAWLAEVKQVNLESLQNWEEKQMFKEFMEDHNTATFPSKKYYNLDAYHQRKMAKEQERGLKKVLKSERTVFNDEEQRRQELLRERERQKEEQVEALKLSMQTGMAQAMKEQAQLREEMAYQYRLGNFEAASAIQRRLDPDVAL